MNRPVSITLSAAQNGGRLGIMERVSFRPKTVAAPILAAVGLGVFYSLNILLTNSRSKERSRREMPRLWDFFDPSGNHEIRD